MAFNSEIHHRHSIRLPDYDYSQSGYYFVTLCAHGKECLFGDIENNNMVLNETGMLVKKKWYELPVHFPGIELYKMILMPNHLHGIIIITDRGGGGMTRGAMTAPLRKITPHANVGIPAQHGEKTLGRMIAWFKYESTKEINRIVSGNPNVKIWQRNFFDRIVRDDEELNRIRNYITTNPENWQEDEDNIFA
jgi:putative transposase